MKKFMHLLLISTQLFANQTSIDHLNECFTKIQGLRSTPEVITYAPYIPPLALSHDILEGKNGYRISQTTYAQKEDRLEVLKNLYQETLVRTAYDQPSVEPIMTNTHKPYEINHLQALYIMQKGVEHLALQVNKKIKRTQLFTHLSNALKKQKEVHTLINTSILEIFFPKGFKKYIRRECEIIMKAPHPKLVPQQKVVPLEKKQPDPTPAITPQPEPTPNTFKPIPKAPPLPAPGYVAHKEKESDVVLSVSKFTPPSTPPRTVINPQGAKSPDRPNLISQIKLVSPQLKKSGYPRGKKTSRTALYIRRFNEKYRYQNLSNKKHVNTESF